MSRGEQAFTLQDLLAEDEIIQEVKGLNPELIALCVSIAVPASPSVTLVLLQLPRVSSAMDPLAHARASVCFLLAACVDPRVWTDWWRS